MDVIIFILFLWFVFVFLPLFLLPRTGETPRTLPLESSSGYCFRKYLLTKAEAQFYKALYPLVFKYGLFVCPKVRLADLVLICAKGRDYFRAFNMVKSKHVDFAICDISTCRILFVVELDDYTHEFDKNKESDIFKDNLFSEISLKLFRIPVNSSYDLSNIESYITSFSEIKS